MGNPSIARGRTQDCLYVCEDLWSRRPNEGCEKKVLRRRTRTMPDGPSPPACRILCLHGGRQTAQIFSDRISRLVAKASRENVEFKFIDAPFADQRDADGLLKEWYGEDGGAQLSTSLSLIEATIVSDGPFDGLLGFSQGALAVAACAIRPHRFPSLKFCILASAPSTPAPQSWDSTDGAACCMPIEGLPTLHMVSTDDRCAARRFAFSHRHVLLRRPR